MTDVPENTDPTAADSEWGRWGAGEAATQPQATTHQRADHRFTLSITPDKAPFMVIRGETAQEINQALTELEMHGTWANVAAANATMRSHGTIGAGLGPVTVVPQGPPTMPQDHYQQQVQHQAQQAPQWGPPLGAGGQPGTAPAAWQNAGAPPAQQGWGGQQQTTCPPGWFVVDIPFSSKMAGDAIKNDLKARGMYQGNVKWDGTAKKWYVSPAVAGAFAAFSPVPG
jgi:hypothetical protein